MLVAEILEVRLQQQVGALHSSLVSIQHAHPEDVHDVRLACRRLRAALSTFAPAFDEERTGPLGDELRCGAQALGAERDRHVVRERLLGLAAGEGEDGQPIRDLVAAEARAAIGVAPVSSVLESERFAALVEAVDELAAYPPWTARAEREARPFVRRRVRGEWRRLARRVEELGALDDPALRDEGFHDVRKAAKRMRYALEVAEFLWPHKAGRLLLRVRRLTDVLGERQDSVVTRAAVAELARRAEAAGEPTFVHGRLDRMEEARAAELEVEFQAAWTAAERRRRAWPRSG